MYRLMAIYLPPTQKYNELAVQLDGVDWIYVEIQIAFFYLQRITKRHLF